MNYVTGKTIRELRKKKKLTQKQLAEQLQISDKTVSKWETDEQHCLQIETVDNEYYFHMEHPMTKEHYVSFLAYVTSNQLQLVKLYPEQNVECRFAKRGHGFVYAYCNKHGLYRFMV